MNARRRVRLARDGWDWRDRPIVGAAYTEYGDRTVWVRVPRRAAVVVTLWRVRWERLVRLEGREVAELIWRDWRETREEDGVR